MALDLPTDDSRFDLAAELICLLSPTPVPRRSIQDDLGISRNRLMAMLARLETSGVVLQRLNEHGHELRTVAIDPVSWPIVSRAGQTYWDRVYGDSKP